jgi:hypothetical protein
MQSIDFPVAIKEKVLAKRIVTRRVTDLKLKCGHALMAINPVSETHICYFCNYPKDKGLMSIERRWLPREDPKNR